MGRGWRSGDFLSTLYEPSTGDTAPNTTISASVLTDLIFGNESNMHIIESRAGRHVEGQPAGSGGEAAVGLRTGSPRSWSLSSSRKEVGIEP